MLKLTYIENIGGLTPPSQTTLTTPNNGDILYDTTGDVVAAPQSIQLSWVQTLTRLTTFSTLAIKIRLRQLTESRLVNSRK